MKNLTNVLKFIGALIIGALIFLVVAGIATIIYYSITI
jgi:hypothetical protein